LTVYAGASDRPRAILVFEQSDVRAPFYAAIFSGLRAKVNSAQTRPVTLYVENLDLGRFHGAGYEQSLSERFAIKYQDSPIGVILTVGSAALDHAIRCGVPSFGRAFRLFSPSLMRSHLPMSTFPPT
jgi:hypothetical protein